MKKKSLVKKDFSRKVDFQDFAQNGYCASITFVYFPYLRHLLLIDLNQAWKSSRFFIMNTSRFLLGEFQDILYILDFKESKMGFSFSRYIAFRVLADKKTHNIEERREVPSDYRRSMWRIIIERGNIDGKVKTQV